jgi:transposase
MQGRQRRSFSDDYKRQAVDLVMSSGRSVTSAANEPNLRDSVLRRWVDKARLEPTAATQRPITQAPLMSADQASEIAKLRQENERMRVALFLRSGFRATQISRPLRAPPRSYPPAFAPDIGSPASKKAASHGSEAIAAFTSANELSVSEFMNSRPYRTISSRPSVPHIIGHFGQGARLGQAAAAVGRKTASPQTGQTWREDLRDRQDTKLHSFSPFRNWRTDRPRRRVAAATPNEWKQRISRYVISQRGKETMVAALADIVDRSNRHRVRLGQWMVAQDRRGSACSARRSADRR